MKGRQDRNRNRLEQVCPMVSFLRKPKKIVHTHTVELGHLNQRIHRGVLPFPLPCAQCRLRNAQLFSSGGKSDFLQFSRKPISSCRTITSKIAMMFVSPIPQKFQPARQQEGR